MNGQNQKRSALAFRCCALQSESRSFRSFPAGELRIDQSSPQLFCDLSRPPSPLEPSAWPLSTSELFPNVLTLDFVAVIGGPFRAFAENLAAQAKVLWRWSPPVSVANDSLQEQALLAEAKALLKIGGVLLETPTHPYYQRLGPTGVVPQIALLESREDWFRAWLETLAPEFCTLATGSARDRWLESYRREMPDVEARPWESLRFFAGHLRRFGAIAASQAMARDWARFWALYSPQDEVVEQSSLAEGEMMLNPTAQLVRSPAGEKPSVDVFYRVDGKILIAPLTPAEAAFIDELSENPRLQMSAIHAGAREHVPSQISNLALREALDHLVAKKLILVG